MPDIDNARSPSARSHAGRRDRSFPTTAVVIGVLLSVALRVRMFWTPITSDEGGFLAIARAWAHGDVLYRDVWVDRPQGLLVVFRVWDAVSGGSAASLRILAMIFGAALVVAVATAVTSLFGRTAGAAAALLVAVSSASPAIEGHLANGELLSGTFAVAGFAVGCIGLGRQTSDDRATDDRATDGRATDRATDRRRIRWSADTLLVLSGVLGGLALSIKQSGYEGLVAIGMWLVLAIVFRWRTVGQSTGAAWRMAAGTGAVIGVLAIHGALTGFSRWWFAFAGYRLESRSAVTGADWDRFFATARVARPIIWPLLAIAVAGLVAVVIDELRRRNRLRTPSIGDGRAWLLATWVASATTAFATGGQFHRHYWVTLTPAFAAAAAVLITRRLRPQLAFAFAAALLVPTAVDAVDILRLPNDEVPLVASNDPRPVVDEQVAAWTDANLGDSQDIYVMCASAAFYAVAEEDPPFPYLWQDNVLQVPGALDSLRDLLDSPTRPDYIAVYQHADTCDPSGSLGRVVAANYEPFTVTDGVQILISDDDAPVRAVSRTSVNRTS